MLSASDFVTVGRLMVPREALYAVIDAELKGVRLQADGECIVARPSGILSEQEKDNLKRWRWHVLAILDACSGPQVQVQ